MATRRKLYISSTQPAGVEACSELQLSELYTSVSRAQTNNLLAALLPGLALPGLAVLPCLASLECSMEARFSPTSSEEEAGSESSPVDGQSSSYRSSGRLRSSLSSPKTPKQWRHRGTE